MADTIHVLHVDDEPGFADMAADFLEREDERIAVSTETSASDALDLLADDGVDCIVSDYDMPGQNGIEFLETVREEHPDLPFIFYTGKGSEEIASDAMTAGATDYLQKGGGTEQYELLANRVLNAVEQYRANQLEEDFRKQSNLLEQLFKQIPVHLYVKDTDGRHLWVSEHLIDDADARLGKTDREIFAPEFGEESYADDMQVIDSEEPIIDKEEYLPHQDEWHLTSKVPWYDEGGELAGLLGVTWDISERKAYEQELERQNERLEEFVSVVSHDLRNPLSVVKGRLELAQSECDSGHLDDAGDAVERSLVLIDDLLTLAREGKAVGETEAVKLADLVDGCWRAVETMDATLVTATEQTIWADSSRLQQLLENLFRNAVEHGGNDVTVTVGELNDRDGFSVADDGPGIPEDERDKVFEAGYSTTDKGTGFGLHIVREIANAHGWEISVTDSEDGGARFEITSVDVHE